MKATNILNRICLVGGVIFLYFTSCSNLEDTPNPVMTRYNLPSQVLDNVFTPDIPEEIRNVDNFLDRMVREGMIIHQGDQPPEIYDLNGSIRVGLKFVVDSDCIYDGRNGSNVDSEYGRYEETIQISRDQNTLLAEVSYSSLEGPDFPDFPNGLDTGSGRGYVSGNGNNFTIFYKVENGLYGDINYQAIWIISGTVSNSPYAREISNVTKCLVMLGKDTDREDKVANRGTVRIFRDNDPDWIQPVVLISDVTPTEGPYSTVVTINGSGFGSIGDSLAVRFNGVIADVLEASSSQLRVTVPKGAGSGSVSVQVNEIIGVGPDFNYIPVYTVSTLAGRGEPGFISGSGDIAMFNFPNGVAVDVDGNIYVADTENNSLRRITPDGEVSTPNGQFDPDGYIFFRPNGVTVDIKGNMYVADTGNSRIAKISPTGEVSFVTSQFKSPSGLTIDNNEALYFSDISNNSIYILTPEGEIINLAPRYPFNNPRGIAVDPTGQVYIADSGNNQILRISPDGQVVTLAGSEAGFQDGTGDEARFDNPIGVALDPDGTVYVADMGNHRIRKIDSGGNVTTLAGSEAGFQEGIGGLALFNLPSGVAVDHNGVIYVADTQNHRIRKMVLE